MKIIPLAAAALLFAPLPAVARQMTEQRATAIDAVAKAEMTRVGAKGMALAVVENGKVVLVRAYGVRNEAGDPLRTDTIMYAASITKAMFAYTVLRLVDEGRFTLDTPIAQMLPKPLPDYGNVDGSGNWGDLAGDDRWRRLTPRIILTHSTGFANFAFLEPDRKLRFHFEPGSRYAYSGEGINLLQFAIGTGLGIDVIGAVDRLTFRPLGMMRSGMVWNQSWSDNFAVGWDASGIARGHSMQRRPRAAGSMDTTIEDVARLAAALVNGTGLSAQSRRELTRPELPITTTSQFPTLQPEARPDQQIRGLGAALGVETFTGPQGPGFVKGGHNDWTGNMMVCVARGKRCAVVMGNDVRVERAIPNLIRAVLGDTGTSWSWKYPDLHFTAPAQL